MRDFTYNEEELAAGKNEMTKLVTDKKKQFVSFIIFWGYIGFSVINQSFIYKLSIFY